MGRTCTAQGRTSVSTHAICRTRQPYFWILADRLPVPTDEYRTQFSVYAVAASPLIVSTDIRNMTEIMKQILLNKDVLAVNQQTTPPGDVSVQRSCRDRCFRELFLGCLRQQVVGEIAGSDPTGGDKVQVWVRELEVAMIDRPPMIGLAVAAVNFANSTRTVQIPLSMVNSGWGKQTKVQVDDLWEHTGKAATGSLEVTIYAHDTKLLLLHQN